jgi:asparagine synthase (glutamine-hydrolysing)
MCGIAGIVQLNGGEPASAELLRAICDTLVHRGPDDEGFHLQDGVGLGMRRLSIIDVEGGKQPLFNEDRSVRVVFNGEIYNFRELRRELEAAGHRLRSGSDGEVIPHLWEEHGPEFLSRLNGMFAIALHDVARRRVVLARDRLGIKPLFYAITPGEVVFASEIKALLASGRVSREPDLDSLGQFVAWEYVPAPGTLFRHVRKLEPGWMLTVDCQRASTDRSCWWDLPVGDGGDAPRDDDQWGEAVAATLTEAVRRQLVSDVPLGAFLSGGVDSSLVVAGMGAARTFSIGFDDPSYNESVWAGKVADHLGVSHRVEILEPDVRALFDHLMHFMDDPIGDFSIFPTYLVSKVAREEVTVALTGDGGDELFGGYETYVAQEKARTWQRIPSLLRRGLAEPLINALPPQAAKKGLINKAKRFVEGLAHDARLEHARWRLFVGEALRRQLFTPEAYEQMTTPVEQHVVDLLDRAGDRPGLERRLYADVKSYLVDNCLVKVDRMSMACSLEARVPFLDHEVAELAFRAPSHLKVNGGSTKVLLKRLAAARVPRECVYRPKEGFSIPIKHWLNGPLRPLFEELLDERAVAEQGLFQPATVARLKREHTSGRANHSHILWALMVFQEWRRRWAS